jgi:peptidoglycan/LPS O-acetylase OafA/YrhL
MNSACGVCVVPHKQRMSMTTQTTAESLPNLPLSSASLSSVSESIASEHISELDGIRGFAAIIVVFHHIAQSFSRDASPHLFHVWLAVTRAGFIGVDIFFALSGFLITRVLLSTRLRPRYYRNFYARRILRLAAPYLITLALVACFIPNSWAFLALSFIYLANFSEFFGIEMIYYPLWSLAVEEHFYLIWPWLVRYLRPRSVMLIALVGCLITPVFRYIAIIHNFFHPADSWFRFDGMLWGAVLAIWITSTKATRRNTALLSASAFLLGGFFYIAGAVAGGMNRASVIGSTTSFGLVSLATTGLIGLAAVGVAPRLLSPLRFPPLRFFGDISYWMYLFHLLVMLSIERFFPPVSVRNYLLITAIVFAACCITGIAIRKWVELPLQSLKRYFR